MSYRLQLRLFYFYECWGQILPPTKPFVNKLFSVSRIQRAVSIETSLYHNAIVVRLEGQGWGPNGCQDATDGITQPHVANKW